jgi:hypothetical protein
MSNYPRGTRLLFLASRVSGIGVHELYQFAPLRWLITLLDKLDGRPPT